MANTYYMRDPQGRIYQTNNARLWSECERLTRAEGARLYRAQACADLRAILKPGATVYTLLRSVSRSGMSRRISCMVPLVESRVLRKDGRRVSGYATQRVPVIRDISYMVAAAIDYRTGPDNGIIVNGCGMDMGFAIVYSLGRSLWPDGTAKPHGTRNGKPDSDGGYSLNHSWL